ncbi:SDR family NAD(P)-dependent oxidoreductase [Petralouisia muris]|uniref:SDR family NAD(P)-dependent oxidoreductase n=1 Tax=Petralouisia muris TaxID=3032872 RepID=A0AC61RNN7_9FIRM|nr:SDR family NAD(P)-dependent oxidoreductase [Petralouisia muris]TGY87716.1 SDR family NAD(P)-dependent oxidoreductase [Petralouisia muris]
MSMFDIKGKKAIVTGGSRGLGYAMAEGLHEAGAEVVLMASNENNLIKAARKLGEQGAKVHYAAADLSQADALERAYKNALESLGGHLDILVNGAGVQYRCKAEDFPTDRWQWVINVNLNAVFVLSQLAGRTMLTQGKGKIINIASMTSFFGSEMVPAYSASKGGVMQLTKALSNEWMSKGINVNAIAPGYMVTQLTGDMKEKNPKQYEEITGRIPAHRWGKPEDLQGTVVFLASRASDYISGAIIPVDGGYSGK